MNRTDLAKQISGFHNVTFEKAKEIVEGTLSIIISELSSGTPVQLNDFGNFTIKQRDARKGRNPHTGEAIDISAKMVVTFKPAPALKRAIQKRVSRFSRS